MGHKKLGTKDKLLLAKASITVFENTNEITKKLGKCLELQKIRAEIISTKYKNNIKIKSSDIYIINTTDFNQEQKYSLVRKIAGASDHVYLFLLNEKLDVDIDNMFAQNQYGIQKDSTALTYITCDEKGLEQVINTIKEVENTKEKINDLWRKVQAVS